MKLKILVSGVCVLFCISTLSGCVTVPDEHQGAATGAGIGAATGAVAGAIFGKDTKRRRR